MRSFWERTTLIIIWYVLFCLFYTCSNIYAQKTEDELLFDMETLDAIRRYEQLGATEKVEMLLEEREEGIVVEEVPWKAGLLGRAESYLKRLHPYVEIEERFEDNIFRTHMNEKSDLISTVTPGTKFELGDPGTRFVLSDKRKSKAHLFLNGGVEFKTYARHNKYNIENPYANFYATRRFNRLSFDTFYQIKRHQTTREELLGSRGRFPVRGAEGTFINYWGTNYGLGSRLKFNRLILETDYTHKGYKYERQDLKSFNSYIDDSINLTANIKVFTKTYILVSYERGVVDYYKDNVFNEDDNTYHRYYAGVKGKISPKVSGWIKAGYQHRNTHVAEKLDQENSAVDVNLFYRPMKRLTWRLQVKRGNLESGYIEEDTRIENLVSLGLRYAPAFNKKLLFKANVSYETYEYDSDRTEKTYRASLNVRYELRKWMKIVGEYNLWKKTETIPSQEVSYGYLNNAVMLKTIFEF